MSPEEIRQLSFTHLQQIVAIDSESDENSPSIPSTEGQRELAAFVGSFYERLEATVETDEYANVIASFPGRGAGAHKPPVALMVHLDTAHGTVAVNSLNTLADWDGSRVPYPENDTICVDLDTYPAAAEFRDQTLVYGPGDDPFGLDDKLGLTHAMTLAKVLASDVEWPHPPLLLVARPDEEIGRMAAVVGLAKNLAARGVHTAYTLDGLLPYEINVENFNAAKGTTLFQHSSIDASGDYVEFLLSGVNTHGATAKAEGHRAATRFGAQILASLESSSSPESPPIRVVHFHSDPHRECDAVIGFSVPDGELETLSRIVGNVVGPHIKRGASWRQIANTPDLVVPTGAAESMLRFVERFIGSDPGFELLAEDSEGRQGYTHPNQACRDADGIRLDFRIRDFETEGLAARCAHLSALRPDIAFTHQYVNMRPRLADRPDLAELPRLAAEVVGVETRVVPIRGGTGVDPFLDVGLPVANLGTGYFAPESEKEFTTLEFMSGHVSWLMQLLKLMAER